MRLRQKYEISGKPRSVSWASVLSDKLNNEAEKDIDALTNYLSERGTEISYHNITQGRFACHGRQIPTGTTYYHMNNGLTVSVLVASYGKNWLFGKEYKHLPKEIDVRVDIFGDGSEKLRRELRKNVFGKENRKVIKSN